MFLCFLGVPVSNISAADAIYIIIYIYAYILIAEEGCKNLRESRQQFKMFFAAFAGPIQ